MTSTASTRDAQAHARAQAGTVVDAMPVVPASRYGSPRAGVGEEDLTWVETVGGGGYTSKVIARGTVVRMTDRDGDACAHVVAYNADQPWERLNVADTVKVPWQAYVTVGHPLLSDQGRVLATVISDTSAAHDALCGVSSRARNEQRYGDGSAPAAHPRGGSFCCWRPPSTASARATLRPECRSSRARGWPRTEPFSLRPLRTRERLSTCERNCRLSSWSRTCHTRSIRARSTCVRPWRLWPGAAGPPASRIRCGPRPLSLRGRS